MTLSWSFFLLNIIPLSCTTVSCKFWYPSVLYSTFLNSSLSLCRSLQAFLTLTISIPPVSPSLLISFISWVNFWFYIARSLNSILILSAASLYFCTSAIESYLSLSSRLRFLSSRIFLILYSSCSLSLAIMAFLTFISSKCEVYLRGT